MFNCSFHGKNMSHKTDKCYVLNNKKPSTQPKAGKKVFTNKGLKHEINLLCQHAPKDKVLEQYFSVIKKKARLVQKANKKHKPKASVTKSPEDSDSSSDMEMSVNLIEEISPTKKQKLEKYKEPELSDYEKSEEEQAYLKSILGDDSDLLLED